jgi:hypothetical protein
MRRVCVLETATRCTRRLSLCREYGCWPGHLWSGCRHLNPRPLDQSILGLITTRHESSRSAGRGASRSSRLVSGHPEFSRPLLPRSLRRVDLTTCGQSRQPQLAAVRAVVAFSHALPSQVLCPRFSPLFRGDGPGENRILATACIAPDPVAFNRHVPKARCADTVVRADDCPR